MGGEDVGGNQLVKINQVDRERKGVNDLIGDGSNDSYSIMMMMVQLLSWLVTWKASVRKIDDFREGTGVDGD